LQDGEIKPLGDEQTKRVDVRVISATNKNLEASVAEGRFREDLFYRVNVFPIRLPPLRERAEDIFLLADYYIKKAAQNSDKMPKTLNRSALQCLEQYDFPGNVRELENEMKRAMILAGDEKWIKVQHLSEKIRSKTMTASVGTDRQGTLKQMVETLERTVIAETLLEYGGNKTKTAKKLGLSRYGLMKKIQRYGL
jgi:transcriptional regulator with PAS, ATPase and Fis domain